MLRVPLNKSYIKRTIRPLYAFAQATPKACFVDPAWDSSVPIFPGMALMRTSGDNVTLINGVGNTYGLSAFYMGGDGIDEITEQGVNAAAVWVLSTDAEFEILSPAFDETVAWVDPGDGTTQLVTAYTAGAKRGKLVPVGTASAGGNTVGTVAIARLLKVSSPTKIVIGGLQARTA